MFFIEHLCELAKREGHQEYISNIARDISKIINLVAPGTKAGAMNIKVVRKVRTLTHLPPVSAPSHQTRSSPPFSKKTSSMHPDRPDGTHDLDERDVEQRMEEDRERHKRLREDTWAVDPETELDILYASGKAGLTIKLVQDCKDDLKARVQAIELDKLGYGQGDGDTPMGGT
jgi:CTD kinase subunit gamma